MDQLRLERHPGVWHSGGLESDGFKGWRCGLRRSRRVGGGSLAAWRKEEIDAARNCQEKREATDWETYYRRRECRILRSHTHRPSRRAERHPCTNARPTKTCVAPVDASRDLIYFLQTSSSIGGGGGMLPDFFFLFSFPCSADHGAGFGHLVK